MGLSHDLVSQFAKIVNKDTKKSSETTVYGTVVTDGEGNKYVKLDGSDQLTPITNTSSSAKADERVSVLIKDHSATVTGNLSSPSVRTGDFNDLNDQVTDIKRFDLAIANRVEANEASIGDLNAATAGITELLTKKASIEELNAAKAEITDLVATKIDAEVANAKFATIDNLTAATAEIDDLQTKNINIENRLTAHDATITNLGTNYAQIDFSNIGMTAVEKLFTKSGIIDDLHVGDTSITGELVGVTIKGDLIEGNTIKADKLVVKGSDGLFYKLNVDALGEATASSDEKYQNGLDGSVIVAKSITAEKVNVNDLVAFGATIGGFHIEENSIYSGVKNSSNNTTRGIFLGDDGQFATGDQNNFLKFYKDVDGAYKLAISADSMIFSSSGKNVETDINDIKGSMDDRFKEIGVYIRTDADGMELGKERSPIQLRFDNNTIAFTNNGVPISEWTSENFHTGNILVDVLERAQFGNFAFVPRSDGSLSFLKVNNYVSGNLFDESMWFTAHIPNYMLIGKNGIKVTKPYDYVIGGAHDDRIAFFPVASLPTEKTGYHLSCYTKNTEIWLVGHVYYKGYPDPVIHTEIYFEDGMHDITFSSSYVEYIVFRPKGSYSLLTTEPSDWSSADYYNLKEPGLYDTAHYYNRCYSEYTEYSEEVSAWGAVYKRTTDHTHDYCMVQNVKIVELEGR